MGRIITISLVFIAFSARLINAQTSSGGFFHSQSINGKVSFENLYREQKSFIGDVREDQKSLYFIGGLMINTSSYLWNPDLLIIDLDVEYNPESRNETYLLVPDRSEVRTLKKLDLRTTIFRNKFISLNAFANLNQTYYNRELLTNIKSNNQQLGGLLSVNNKFLPLSVSYRKSDWVQKEIETGRDFSMSQSTILGRMSKSFGSSDMHELLYSHDDYTYNYAGETEISNVIQKVALNNNFYFDRNRKYNFNSQLSYYDQAGDNEFAKIEAIERFVFSLPSSFRLTGGYIFYGLEDPNQVLRQNRFSGSLNHQLFESLSTNIFTDYSLINQSIYGENNFKTGIDLNYTKKIPAGRFNLSYTYFRSYYNMTGDPAPVKIINEEHVISDGKITILNKPYVDLSTIMIKDQAGVIIYQLNFDYLINVINNYIEIQRVPGGQISNNQAITADYTANQPGSYSFQADNNTVSTSIQLFKKLFEIYYRGSFQTYHNLVNADYLTLDYYSQNVYGSRFDFGFASIGAEYDNYNSNIIPYKRLRYYLDLNMSIKSKLLISVNGNILDYRLIGDDVNQLFANITGKVSYNFNFKTRLDYEAGYLSQKGKNIDLKLFTSRLEISTAFRQLHLGAGVEMYHRQYLNSDFSFLGTFVEFVRKF